MIKSISKYLLNRINRYVLQLFYNNTVSKSANIHSKAFLNTTKVGSYTYIGPFVVVNNTKIGNYCSIAPGAIIGGMEHDYKALSTSTYLSDYKHLNPTVISDDVWIGAGVYIRAGVTLGKGCIIGSNSTVLKDVPPMAIAVGSPATIIKYRFDDEVKMNIYMELNFDQAYEDLKKDIYIKGKF